MNKSLKTAALAIILVLGTAGGAFAATAWADDDTRVRDEPKKSGDTIDWLYEGEKVDVEGCGKVYCYIEHKGPDGYVLKKDLRFKKHKKHHDADVEVCIGGGGFGGGGFGFGKFCISD